MSAVMQKWIPHHRITVEEYYRMAEVGLLAPDARVELIEGEIIDMPPIGSSHGRAVRRLDRLLQRAVGDKAIVQCQLPVRLSLSSEPQPDLAVLKAREDDYAASHPSGADSLLVIEVSATTLRYDRKVKVPLYARHGVAEVWIVDLKNTRLHVYRSLVDGIYTDVSFTTEPGVTALSALADVAIDLGNLFSS